MNGPRDNQQIIRLIPFLNQSAVFVGRAARQALIVQAFNLVLEVLGHLNAVKEFRKRLDAQVSYI
jgi:hypothetical protein